MKRLSSVLVLLLLAASVSAEITVLPDKGKAVAVASSTTSGRWMVVKAAPFSIVVDLRTFAAGETSYCIWQAEAGIYTAVLIPADQAMPLEFATVVLGSGKPDPDPDPDPTPGKRRVVVIAESADQTAYREVSYRVVRDYIGTKGHTWEYYDPDQTDTTGQVPLWLNKLTTEARKVGLPTLIVLDEKDMMLSATKFPDAGRTAAAGKAAGEAAIKQIKKAGG